MYSGFNVVFFPILFLQTAEPRKHKHVAHHKGNREPAENLSYFFQLHVSPTHPRKCRNLTSHETTSHQTSSNLLRLDQELNWIESLWKEGLCRATKCHPKRRAGRRRGRRVGRNLARSRRGHRRRQMEDPWARSGRSSSSSRFETWKGD